MQLFLRRFFAIALLLPALIFLTAGSSSIFDLDEDTESPSKYDLLYSSDQYKNFELKRIIPGFFSSTYGKNILLVEVCTSFSKDSESQFRLSFAEIRGQNFIRQDQNFIFNGLPIEFVTGDLDSDGLDEVVFQWVDKDLQEWIQVFGTDGIENGLFPPRKVPPGRNEEIALADMDGDGKLEIVVPSLRSELAPTSEIDKVIVYFLMEDKVIQESYAIIPAPLVDLVVMDTNGDKRDEIVTVREVRDGKNKQAVWLIMRRDDGTYAERPVSKGNAIILFPSSPSGNTLYFRKLISSASRYYSQIVACRFEGDDFEIIDETRLLPEGLMLGSIWGKFLLSGDESLAMVIDESMSTRRWLAIYTPIAENKTINRLTLISQNDLNPATEKPCAYDLNFDGIDEFIYADPSGKAVALDPVTQKCFEISIETNM